MTPIFELYISKRKFLTEQNALGTGCATNPDKIGLLSSTLKQSTMNDLIDYLLFLFYIAAGCVAVFLIAMILKEYSYYFTVDIDFGEE